ncbi:hypothetical protein [Agrobacterium vitis]|uniref:hypothetical protein n=1 Tax=Agrobacterium vitis TaxID=373 RepID=UPI003D2A5196
MKNIAYVTFATFVLGSSAALADSVSITNSSQFTSPDALVSSSLQYDFKGPTNIVFKVAGKTCTLKGSAQGSVPMGCNYSIDIDDQGKLTGSLRAGNSVCTPTEQVASSCK